MPGSGLPCCAHSLSECVVAKHSSHLGMALAVPVKLMAYSDEFTTDHRLFPVSAACLRKAES